MFPASYFAPEYFPPEYFAESGATPTTGVYFAPEYFAAEYFAPRYFPGIPSSPPPVVSVVFRRLHRGALRARPGWGGQIAA